MFGEGNFIFNLIAMDFLSPKQPLLFNIVIFILRMNGTIELEYLKIFVKMKYSKTHKSKKFVQRYPLKRGI